MSRHIRAYALSGADVPPRQCVRLPALARSALSRREFSMARQAFGRIRRKAGRIPVKASQIWPPGLPGARG